MNYVPYVIDNTNGHEYHSDLFSRLLSSRIIILSGYNTLVPFESYPSAIDGACIHSSDITIGTGS